MHLGYGVLDGHGDVLLGDLRGRPGAAVPAVQVHDVRSGVIGPDGHHLHVVGRRDLHRKEGLGIDGGDPIQVLLVVLHGIYAVEGEGGEERGVEGGGGATEDTKGRPGDRGCRAKQTVVIPRAPASTTRRRESIQ
ncbi:MAG: hypothetical protein BWY06_02391 [Candidatus Latescibacteria bacterium ADurb.Bin168]|nr:MAG: hypothetical protein BWY06_02391 [Candidatus Latescibacteria bacterium ADurb.Bin168]